jgi:hypothetical protein
LTDLFEEVEEQLRSDRLQAFARKALPWVVAIAAAALVAALAVWGWRAYQQQITDKASVQYQAGISAAAAGRFDEAAQLWGETAKAPARAYKTLALMQLAGLKMGRDPMAAVALFDQAADAAPDPLLGDAARLKSALAILDTAPFSEVEGRLGPLMKEGRPYRLQAREALAYAKLMKGDTAGARGDFVVLQSVLDAPENLRQRSAAAVSLIDSGSAKAVPAAVKAALALPPPPATPPADTTLQPQAPPQQ